MRRLCARFILVIGSVRQTTQQHWLQRLRAMATAALCAALLPTGAHAADLPIFDAHITRWGPHLEVLTDFWCEQMGGPSHYTGSLARHGRLGLGPEHFEKWLEVWRANCRWLLPEPEAGDVILLAERLAVAMREHAS